MAKKPDVPAPAIPEPDYDGSYPSPPPPIGEQLTAAPSRGLRKLSMDSKSDLHKELMWNIKNGIDVLQKKPELQRELERRKEERKRREFEEYEQSRKNTFDIKMERQFRKLELQEQQQLASTGGTQSAGSNGPPGGVTQSQHTHGKPRVPAATARSPDGTVAPPASSVPGRLKGLF